MSIPVRRISKVIIAGQWFLVAPGTFEVTEMEYVDDDGEPVHEPLDIPAYRFVSESRDVYYGPLAAIELIKLMDA